MIALIAIIIAISLGLAVHYYRYKPNHTRAEIETVRRQIEEAKRQHAPRNHLYRKIRDLRMKELAS